MVTWDPNQYGRYADERGRPFRDLLGRVHIDSPKTVVDAGCGPGPLTATLADRWPSAQVLGFDSSPDMTERAQSFSSRRLRFVEADVAIWEPEQPVDVLVSNAVLQWVPGHDHLLARWATFLAPGGWLAIQVPANFDAPSHQAIRRVVGGERWRGVLAPELATRLGVLTPERYLDILQDAGLEAEVWETTYFHVLTGDRPVLEWVKGTALRPILDALPDQDAREAFMVDLGLALDAAYPAGPAGTVFPFRRIFAVGRRPT